MAQTDGIVQAIFEQGNEFEIIFKTYYLGLCRYAGMWIKDADEIEEIVQNVFVGLWEKRESIQINTSIKSYLYKSVYNSALNTIKHQKVKTEFTKMKAEEKTHIEIQTNIEVKELEIQIEKTLKSLPEQCRVIFSMSRFQSLKYREIADILNLSIKTVENQMGKAIKHMRTNLSDYLTLLLFILHFIKN